MSAVVSMLEGKTPIELLTVQRSISDCEDLRFKAFEKLADTNQTETNSSDCPWPDSSLSEQNQGESALLS